MSKIETLLVSTAALGMASIALVGCEQDSDTFEDVGESIDNQVDAFRSTVEDAMEDAEERLEELDE